MAKHTPGPWGAIGADVKTAGPTSRVICWTGVATDIPLDEIRANARLIAAAPDMLQALRDIAAATTGYDSEEVIAEIQGICARIGAKVGEVC